ncbi:MAG: porin family protein [Bacteroidia bacterium]
MREFYFDKLIREKLHNLEVPFSPEDWEEMEFDLEMSDTATEGFADADSTTVLAGGEEVFVNDSLNDFDLKIEEKLADLTESTDPDAWDEFVQNLDEADFDQVFSDKLSDLSLPYRASDWSLMAQGLDDSPFDTAVRNALETLELPYVSSDWYILSDSLAAPFDHIIRDRLKTLGFGFRGRDWRRMAVMLNQEVVSEGIAEPAWFANWKNYLSAAAVVALLLLTFRWSAEVRSLSRPEKRYTEYHAPVFQPENGRVMSSTFSGNWQQATPADLNSSSTPVQISASNDKPSPQVAAQVFASDVILPQKPEYEEMFPGNFNLTEINTVAAGDFPMEIPLVEPVPVYESADLGYSPLNLSPGFKASPLPAHRPSPGIRVGAYGGYTQTKAELSNRSETGFMAGTRLEFLINDNWSVVSGIHYGVKQFRFEYQIFAPQRFDRAVDANLKVLEAPLLIRYNFPSTTPLNLYALTGIVTTVSISENYWEYDPNAPANQGIDRNLLRQQNLPTDERSLNTYVGNIYAAGGLEYQFNDHIAFQVEPYFQMNIQRTKGSGARGFEKQLYTSGFSFSLMYNLSKQQQ